MQKLIVKGKNKLSGVIKISGSKNATLPILAASILNKNKIEEKQRLKNLVGPARLSSIASASGD